MLIIFVVSNPLMYKPGWARNRLGNRWYLRVWWLWFSLTLWPGDDHDFGEAIRGAEWVN